MQADAILTDADAILMQPDAFLMQPDAFLTDWVLEVMMGMSPELLVMSL